MRHSPEPIRNPSEQRLTFGEVYALASEIADDYHLDPYQAFMIAAHGLAAVESATRERNTSGGPRRFPSLAESIDAQASTIVGSLPGVTIDQARATIVGGYRQLREDKRQAHHWRTEKQKRK